MSDVEAQRVEVSVVVAVFQAGDTLATQLDSLAAQVDAPPFEVVLADNGSTDGAIAAALARTDGLVLRVVDASQRRG